MSARLAESLISVATMIRLKNYTVIVKEIVLVNTRLVQVGT
jgi:hypothetical protein